MGLKIHDPHEAVKAVVPTLTVPQQVQNKYYFCINI